MCVCVFLSFFFFLECHDENNKIKGDFDYAMNAICIIHRYAFIKSLCYNILKGLNERGHFYCL